MKMRDAFLGLSAFCLATTFGSWLGFVSSEWKISLPEKTFFAAADMAPAPVPPHDEARVPIVVYHSVRPHIEGESSYQEIYDVTPELLSEHLAYLRDNNFTTITFKALADYFDNGTPLPPKPIILSFDDGWHNQYEYAFPVLKQFHATGTFFVFTNALDRGHHLTLAEAKEMKDAGMEIGSHTKTHPFLDDVRDESVLKNEIGGSKDILQSELGTTIDTFAYPFGEHATSSIEEIGKAGYRTARSLRKGVVQKISERYILPAFLVTDSLDDFKRMVNQE